MGKAHYEKSKNLPLDKVQSIRNTYNNPDDNRSVATIAWEHGLPQDIIWGIIKNELYPDPSYVRVNKRKRRSSNLKYKTKPKPKPKPRPSKKYSVPEIEEWAQLEKYDYISVSNHGRFYNKETKKYINPSEEMSNCVWIPIYNHDEVKRLSLNIANTANHYFPGLNMPNKKPKDINPDWSWKTNDSEWVEDDQNIERTYNKYTKLKEEDIEPFSETKPLTEDMYRYHLKYYQAQKIRKWYNQENVSIETLAKHYRMQEGVIHTVLNNHTYKDENYERTRFEPNQNQEEDEMSPEKKAERLEKAKLIREQYHKDNMNTVELAKKHSMNQATISQILNNKLYVDHTYTRTKFRVNKSEKKQ